MVITLIVAFLVAGGGLLVLTADPEAPDLFAGETLTGPRWQDPYIGDPSWSREKRSWMARHYGAPYKRLPESGLYVYHPPGAPDKYHRVGAPRLTNLYPQHGDDPEVTVELAYR